MQTTTTKSEATGTQTRASAPVSLVTELTRQGVDSALASQRIMLDLVMRQNATTINAVREMVSTSRPPRADALAEVVGEGLANFIAAQRILLNTALRHNEIIMNGAKDRVRGPGAGLVFDVLRRSIETFIDMQQHLLTIAEKQTDSWVERAKTGKAPNAQSLTELFENAMDQLVRSQKKLLDVIAEEAAHAADAAKKNGEPMKVPETGLADMVRQSADAFIDMQKKLLDVAGKQVDVNVKAARHAIDFMKPSMRTSMADLARQYVENLVSAHKSMLDIMVKPRPASRAAEAEPAQPKRRARTAKARTRKAKA